MVLSKYYINQMTNILFFVISRYDDDVFQTIVLILEYENTIIQIV